MESSSPSRPARACSTSVRACAARRDRGLQAAEHDADAQADRLGGPTLADHPLATLGGAGAGLALLAGRAQQPVGPAVQRPGPLLGGAQRQPGVHLALPGGTGGLAQALAVGGVRLLLGAVLARRRAGSRARPGRPGRARAPPRPCAIALSRRSASPRAARACEPYWPSSSATAASVASDSCSLARATSTRFWASSRSASMRDVSNVSRSPAAVASASWVGGLVDRGLDLDQGRLGGGTAGGEVGTEHVAFAGDRGDVGAARRPARGPPAGRRRRRP